MDEIKAGILSNIVLWLLIKGGTALFGFHCGWGTSFWIAFFIVWLGVFVFSVSDMEIDLFD